MNWMSVFFGVIAFLVCCAVAVLGYGLYHYPPKTWRRAVRAQIMKVEVRVRQRRTMIQQDASELWLGVEGFIGQLPSAETEEEPKGGVRVQQ